jgi:hypothetical protein
MPASNQGCPDEYSLKGLLRAFFLARGQLEGTRLRARRRIGDENLRRSAAHLGQLTPSFRDAQEYDLQHAAREAAWEREGKMLITHDRFKLPEEQGDPNVGSGGVIIKNVVTGEELWRGRKDDWPDNDVWVHTDHVGWDSFAASAGPAYEGVPDSLLQALDEWCQSNHAEARQLAGG